MSAKSTILSYRIALGFFAALMTLDAIGGLSHNPEGVKGLAALGYPEYLLTIAGAAKLCGVAAIVQPRFRVLREWGYAGFTINFLLACFSHLAVGQSVEAVFPLVALVIAAVPYGLSYRFRAVREAAGVEAGRLAVA